jgi:hypothetical protein
MINDRTQGGVGPDGSTDGMTYWVGDKQPLTDIKNWRQVTRANFQNLLVASPDKFPAYEPAKTKNKARSPFLCMALTTRALNATCSILADTQKALRGQRPSERRRIPARWRKLQSRSANHSPSQRKPATAPIPKMNVVKIL